MIDSRKGYREEDPPDLGQAVQVCWFCIHYTHGDRDSVRFTPWRRAFSSYRTDVRAHRSCLRMVGFGPVPLWSPIREQGG